VIHQFDGEVAITEKEIPVTAVEGVPIEIAPRPKKKEIPHVTDTQSAACLQALRIVSS
jgi:hypothetical protein